MSILLNGPEATSTRPYLIRALHEWCADNGFTPYVTVLVDEAVQVPREYVKNGEIVLNVSFDATSSLRLGNDFIEFKARFGGSPREIIVPVDRVVAIYARENGQGMAFPAPTAAATASNRQIAAAIESDPHPGIAIVPPPPKSMQLVPSEKAEGDEPPPPKPATGKRPALKRVK